MCVQVGAQKRYSIRERIQEKDSKTNIESAREREKDNREREREREQDKERERQRER